PRRREAAREPSPRSGAAAPARLPAHRHRGPIASDPVTESPAFASEFALHPPSRWAGIIVGAFGAGAVTAAFVVAGRVSGSRCRMVGTLSMLTAGIVGFSLSRTIWLGLAFLAVGGFGYLASNASATSRL